MLPRVLDAGHGTAGFDVFSVGFQSCFRQIFAYCALLPSFWNVNVCLCSAILCQKNGTFKKVFFIFILEELIVKIVLCLRKRLWLYFFLRVSLCNPGWPKNYYVDQAGLA